MIEKEKDQVVTIDYKDYPKGMANPAIIFIFSSFCWLFLGATMGWFGPGSSLALGLIMLACYLPYLYGGISCIQKGDTVSGATFLIFTAMFAGVGGVENLLSYYVSVTGTAVDFTIFGWIWILCAIIIVPVVVTMAKGPWIPFLTFAIAIPELAAMGVATVGGPEVFNTVACVCFVIVGSGSLWMSIALMLQGGGVNAPLGRPLFKE